MNCDRCGHVRGTLRCSLDLTITDSESLDEGVVVGDVTLNLCRHCREAVANQLLEFRRSVVTQEH